MRPTHARGKQSGRSPVEAKADYVTERVIQQHISLYNVLPEAFVVVYSMTSVLVLWKPTYPQRFMLMIYGFFFELWVLNLNKEKEEKKIAHHILIHL